METRIMKILSKNGSVPLKLIYGHFATNHSHINCYLDMTTLKTRQSEAQLAAQALVQHYVATTIVDTILCLDGTQIIGAYLAQELSRAPMQSHLSWERAKRAAFPVQYAQNFLPFPQNTY